MTDDEYGLKKRFKGCSADQLIKEFNKEVGNSGWAAARGVYLAALHSAFLATGLDCSNFINQADNSMSLKSYEKTSCNPPPDTCPQMNTQKPANKEEQLI